jgi:hypothetical protein
MTKYVSPTESTSVPEKAKINSVCCVTFVDVIKVGYYIEETSKGPDVSEIRWTTCWQKTHTDDLVSHQYTLIRGPPRTYRRISPSCAQSVIEQSL